MAAIRLEKFAPMHRAEVGPRLISQEEIEAIRKEATEVGIREGATAASEAFSSEQSRCLSQIQEVVGDTFFAREEAHRMALGSLHPLIKSLAEAIAPTLCESGLSSEIAKIAEAAAERAPSDALSIFVPMEMVDEISGMLSRSDPVVTVSGDPLLSNSQARVNWNGGFDQIDLEAAADTALEAIKEFFTELDSPKTERVQNAI